MAHKKHFTRDRRSCGESASRSRDHSLNPGLVSRALDGGNGTTAETRQDAGEGPTLFRGDEEGAFRRGPAPQRDFDIPEKVLSPESHQMLDGEVVHLEVGVIEKAKPKTP